MQRCALSYGREHGGAMLTAIIFSGVAAMVIAFTIEYSLHMLQLTQSTSQQSDLASLERSLSDNLSCAATLGARPVTCHGGTYTLRGTDGSALTDAAGKLGGMKLTATCTNPTGTDPNQRLSVTASIRDPLKQQQGVVTVKLFSRPQTVVSYPCLKYMNVGPRFQVVKYPGSAFKRYDFSCYATGPGGPWGHSSITMTCPTGYFAASGVTICSYKVSGTPYGGVLAAYTGGGAFSEGRGVAEALTSGQAFVDCCAPPPPAKPNPGYVVCVRS